MKSTIAIVLLVLSTPLVYLYAEDTNTASNFAPNTFFLKQTWKDIAYGPFAFSNNCVAKMGAKPFLVIVDDPDFKTFILKDMTVGMKYGPYRLVNGQRIDVGLSDITIVTSNLQAMVEMQEVYKQHLSENSQKQKEYDQAQAAKGLIKVNGQWLTKEQAIKAQDEIQKQANVAKKEAKKIKNAEIQQQIDELRSQQDDVQKQILKLSGQERERHGDGYGKHVDFNAESARIARVTEQLKLKQDEWNELRLKIDALIVSMR